MPKRKRQDNHCYSNKKPHIINNSLDNDELKLIIHNLLYRQSELEHRVQLLETKMKKDEDCWSTYIS